MDITSYSWKQFERSGRIEDFLNYVICSAEEAAVSDEYYNCDGKSRDTSRTGSEDDDVAYEGSIRDGTAF